MRVEERPVIPVTKTEKVYIARDNKEFSSERQCLKHERILTLKEAISHIKYKEVDIIDSLSGGEAYYITNENDFEAVKNYFCESYPYGYNCNGDWEYKGENWYMFYSEDGGSNYADSLYCYNLDYYKEAIDVFLKQFN